MQTLLKLVLVAVAATAVVGKYEDRFVDYGVYVIENRAHQAVLTFVEGRNEDGSPKIVPPTIMELNLNDSSQRWRLDESALYTAFELRPMKNEHYVLEYYPEKGILSWFVFMGNTKLWYLMDAGDGYTVIRHKRYNICLDASEPSLPVAGHPCRGTFTQQWLLKLNANVTQ